MPKDFENMQDVLDAVKGVNEAFEAFKGEMADEVKNQIGSALDVLSKDKLEKIEKDIEDNQKKLDDFHLKQRDRKIIIDGNEVDQDELDAKALAWANVASEFRSGKNRPQEFTHDDMKNYNKLFMKWVCEGKDALTADEIKALSVGSDPDGGYVVSADTSGRIVQRQFDTSPVRAYASTQMISTNELEGLYDIDEADSGWVSETGSRAETGTPQLQQWRIPVHEQYAEPRATQKLLDDAFINVDTWLINKVSDKFTRVENAAFINGDGVGKPRGLLTYDDWDTAGTYQLRAVEQFDTGVSGGFAADPNGPDVLYDAIYGIQDFYRNGAVWFANRGTFGVIRKMQDSNGNYMWQPSVAAGEPATLAGYATATFEDMPDISAGSLSLGFGNLAAGYQIVDRMGVRILRDPFTAKPYIKFYTTKRVGGDVIDFAAFKLIKFTI